MAKITFEGSVDAIERDLKALGPPAFEDLFVKKIGGFPARRPFGISAGAWFYERKHWMVVVIEARSTDGQWATTVQTAIPWRTVKRSVDRFLRANRPMGNAARSAGLTRLPKGKARQGGETPT